LRLDPGHRSPEGELLFLQEPAHRWVDRTIEACTRHLYADSSASSRGSRSRDIPPEFRPTSASTHPLKVAVPDESIGYKLQFLPHPVQ